MSDFNGCKKCGVWDFMSRHSCLPEWEAKTEDDERYKAFGIDEEDAAENLVSRYFDNWDYPEDLDVWIRKPGEKWKKFNVTVEPIPHFSAREIE